MRRDSTRARTMSTAVSIDLFEIPKIKRTDESASQNVW